MASNLLFAQHMFAFVPFMPLVSALVVATAPPGADQGSRLAIIDSTGRVLSSADDGISWVDIHRCPVPDHDQGGDIDTHDALLAGSHEQRTCAGYATIGSLAWLDHTLYVACTARDGLWAWTSDAHRAQPVPLGSTPSIRALAAFGPELLIADAEGRIFSHRPGRGVAFRARAPEPVIAMASWRDEFAVAGQSAIWASRPSDQRVWRLVAALRTCSLAAQPDGERAIWWSAGPDGLARIGPDSVQWHDILPHTGVATSVGHIWIADGAGLERMAVPSHAAPDGPGETARDHEPGTWTSRALIAPMERIQGLPSPARAISRASHWSRMRTRARWSFLMPRVGAGISLSVSHAPERRTALQFWIWLTWQSPGHEVSP